MLPPLSWAGHPLTRHTQEWACAHVLVPEKFLVGETCPPVDLKYIHFVKNRLVTGHGEHYSNLKSAGTSWAWAFTRHSVKSFTCIIILIFTSTLWSGNYCSHYRAEETEAQKDRNSLKVSLLVNSRARIQFKYPSLTPKRLVNGRREKDTTNHFKALSVF